MTNNSSLTEREFYDLRDNRTNLIANSDAYQNASLLLAVDDEAAQTLAGQVMALTAANIFSRFGRDVDLAILDTQLVPALVHPLFDTTLVSRIIQEMEAGDPFGSFTHISEPTLDDGTSETSEYDCTLVIGERLVNADPSIYIDAMGWSARITRGETPTQFSGESRNPIGPAVAACLGTAEVFKIITNAPAHQQPSAYTFDTYTLTPNPTHNLHIEEPVVPETIHTGTIELVGVGSVGSAVLYFLHLLPVNGDLTLIDLDHVEYGNLNRSPIFTEADATLSDANLDEVTPKVAVGERFICDHIKTTSFAEKYGESRSQDQSHPDIILPEVDDDRAREAIQYSRPPLMFETLTDGSAVDVRHHQPIDEPCLLCHLPPGDASYDPTCATSPHSLEEDQTESSDDDPDAALPFVSYLAGVFLAAELVKTQYNMHPNAENYVSVETFSDFEVQDRYNEPWNAQCPYCEYTNSTFHQEQIADTLFFDSARPQS